MNLSIGIVGLPNVGKSTLFNAVTNQNIPAENFPFCTIDPNIGIVAVHDPRLRELQKVVNSKKTIPAYVKFVDIAGIVKGAAEGEGLGNKFLSHIKEVDLLVHVIRAFELADVVHVENRIDPKADKEIIETELLLKDVETLDKKLLEYERKAKTGNEMKIIYKEMVRLKKFVSEGNLASRFESDKEVFSKELADLNLLTMKRFIYLINSSNADLSEEFIQKMSILKEDTLLMDIKLEAEIVQLPDNERVKYIKELGLNESGLEKLTKLAYKKLNLMSFFTAGPEEVRAWTIKIGDTAYDASSAIHTDFQDKFIGADIVSFKEFIASNGWEGSKENGKVRFEGRDYVMNEADVVFFKHNA